MNAFIFTLFKKRSYVLCVEVKSISIFLLRCVCVGTGVSSPAIQQDIHNLKDLRYTGKGVKIGVLDYFQGPQNHGSIVLPFIKEGAPQAEKLLGRCF